jgi:hypothetical protein
MRQDVKRGRADFRTAARTVPGRGRDHDFRHGSWPALLRPIAGRTNAGMMAARTSGLESVSVERSRLGPWFGAEHEGHAPLPPIGRYENASRESDLGRVERFAPGFVRVNAV